jgi:pilus assembly protein FimV
VLMENAVYIGGGVAALVALLGALAFLRRRRSREEEGQESILTNTDGEGMDREGPMSGLTTEETSFLDNLSTTGGFTTTLSSSDESEADETSFLSDFVPSDVEALQEDTGEVDPLAEADVYIAYGRYKQAEELIRQALDKSPGNHGLRYKLFEIFHAAKDGAAFDGAIREAQTAGMEVGDPSGWQKVLAMQGDLRKGGAAKPAPAAAEEEFDLGDLEGGLGDLEISGVGAEEGAPTAAAAAQGEDFGDLGDLDFGLDLTGLGGDEPAAATAAKPAAAGREEEELDLSDLLGDLDVTGLGTGKAAAQPAAAKAAPQKSAEEVFDLDLGLDLDLGGDLGGDSSSAKTGAAGELLGGLGRGAGNEEAFDLDLSLSGLGSGIPDLGRQIGGEPGEAEGLQVTGLTKPAKTPGGGGGELLDFDLNTSLAAEALGGGVEAASADEGEVETKIDLARAYIDMGDAEGARDILNEVVQEGTAAQKAEAQKLIAGL